MKINRLNQLFASILANAVYAMKNFPVMLINTVLAPFGLLIIIFFVSHGALLNVGILGGFILVMVNNGISIQGDLTHLRNDMKLQDMLVSSPVSPAIYIAGIALSELVFSIPDLLVLSVLAVIFIHISAAGALTLAAVMLLTFMFSVSLGFFISTISRDVIEGWAFMGLIAMVLSTLPPVYYPITYVPMPFRYIAYLSPTTFSAMIAQESIGVLNFSGSFITLSWIILAAVSVFLLVFAIKRSKWRED
ncbi:MAG: ABC transporter permease [Candidatus Parvarchaeota archaeon]|jgi:ABC-2 type transporter./Integral membrane protein S linking to the trans Golgi network.|nr:ABC transporter permease [Candidatus Parvarchaeota archaeon]MCL5420173.1 ABC transporter permease [Candidatus Parvarchaeota archaeon]